MQPLVYLAVRLVVSLFQLVEEDRALVGSVALTLATGAAHCWAVVWALIIAVVSQYRRLQRDGLPYEIPQYVVRAEQAACASMGLWVLVGCAICLVRTLQVDDCVQGLPTTRGEAFVPKWLLALISPRLRQMLIRVHMLSCSGLFVSIMLLCFAIASQAESFCEYALVLLAIGFALPHAAVALRRLLGAGAARLGSKQFAGCSGAVKAASVAGADRSSAPVGAAAAELVASREAAAIGPQLCLILACAEVRGEVRTWQRFAHGSVAACFVALLAARAIAAAGDPRSGGPSDDPPWPAFAREVILSMVLDVVAAAMIMGFFIESQGLVTVILGLFALLLALAVCFAETREAIIEIVEPLLRPRERRRLGSSAAKALPRTLARSLRWATQASSLFCASAGIWSLCAQPAAQSADVAAAMAAAAHDWRDYGDSHDDHSHYHHFDHGLDGLDDAYARDYHEPYHGYDEGYDSWHRAWLLLPWSGNRSGGAPSSTAIAEAVAEALSSKFDDADVGTSSSSPSSRASVDVASLMVSVLPEHRLGVIGVAQSYTSDDQWEERWKEALKAPRGLLLALVGEPGAAQPSLDSRPEEPTALPPYLDHHECDHLSAEEYVFDADSPDEAASAEEAQQASTTPAPPPHRAALLAACEARWRAHPPGAEHEPAQGGDETAGDAQRDLEIEHA